MKQQKLHTDLFIQKTGQNSDLEIREIFEIITFYKVEIRIHICFDPEQQSSTESSG